ncbi:MAG: hypothetical protein QOI05_197 [Bradyrhizobium sp.]|jgi:hypothetical protein|nr:hypothetical protein [Bradyrhizobium sp.]
MNRSQSAAQAKAENIVVMGDPLGELYSALWHSVATAHVYWKEYVELFGSKPSRITLLNKSAPAFFHMLQEELWEASLLRLARLTDAPKSMGNPNLTMQALPALITDASLTVEVTRLVGIAVADAAFCRDWRNRRIAHNDLKLALDQPTTPLADASRLQVKTALLSLTAVLNAIAGHYYQTEIRFDVGGRIDGAVALLHVLSPGVKAQDARQKRLEAGTPIAEDFEFEDL